MGYCTEADLAVVVPPARLDEYGAESGGDPSAVLEGLIEDVSGKMDARLAARYTVPVTDANSLRMLKGVCRTICRFEIMGRRQLVTEGERDPIYESYKEAIRLLDAIATGKASLSPSATPVPVPEAGTDEAGEFDSQPPVFDEQSYL